MKKIEQMSYDELMVECVRRAADLAVRIATEYIDYKIVGYIEADDETTQSQANKFNAMVDYTLFLIGQLNTIKRVNKEANQLGELDGKQYLLDFLSGLEE